jgi:hypothetical protein
MSQRVTASVVPEFDIGGILEALVDADVEFLVIGGVAVGFHGYVRATKDVASCHRPTPRTSSGSPRFSTSSTPRSRGPRSSRMASCRIRWRRVVKTAAAEGESPEPDSNR